MNLRLLLRLLLLLCLVFVFLVLLNLLEHTNFLAGDNLAEFRAPGEALLPPLVCLTFCNANLAGFVRIVRKRRSLLKITS